MGRSILFKGYKIQWADRKPGTDYPASTWKTVSGAASITDPQEVQARLEALIEEYPDRLFRGWLKGA